MESLVIKYTIMKIRFFSLILLMVSALSIQADDPKTHHDRIDFVYFKGNGLKVTDAKIIGENEENADIVVAPYPSDHRAVVATFTLTK